MKKLMKIVAFSFVAVLLAPAIVLAIPVDRINPGLGEVRPDPWIPPGGTHSDNCFKDEPNPGLGEPRPGGCMIPIAPDPGVGEGSGSIPVASPDPGVGWGWP